MTAKVKAYTTASLVSYTQKNLFKVEGYSYIDLFLSLRYKSLVSDEDLYLLSVLGFVTSPEWLELMLKVVKNLGFVSLFLGI